MRSLLDALITTRLTTLQLGVLRALDIAPSPRGPVQRATETTAIDLTSDGDESETDNKELEALKGGVFHLNPSVSTHYQRNPY